MAAIRRRTADPLPPSARNAAGFGMTTEGKAEAKAAGLKAPATAGTPALHSNLRKSRSRLLDSCTFRGHRTEEARCRAEDSRHGGHAGATRAMLRLGSRHAADPKALGGGLTQGDARGAMAG